ncbi:MAG TPA: site-specific integrase [Opitutus sp.]|nr:site-specific integrase [Opitutus sp.]
MAPATKSRRETAVKALLKTWPDLPSRDARRVTATDAQQWGAKALREGTGFIAPNAKKVVGKGMSPSAFNHCHEALKAVFAIAIEHGAAYANPADSVSRAAIKKKRLELPTMAQFHEIVNYISNAGARQSKDCADLTRLLAFSGVRIAEAGILRWHHVDEVNGRLTVPGTKSETSHRIVPLFPALKSLLVEIRSRRIAAGVEQSVETPILNVKECTRALRSACRKAGAKNLSHHDLRHLFATTCIESGVDIPTVSRWLGHSDGGALAMRTYGHLRDQHSQAQAAKVNFGGAS